MKLQTIILFLFLSPFLILAQNCIDYGEFDDSPCDICGPGDWDPIWAAEIDDAATLSWCINLTESPTGGTMVALDITQNPEGIETTIDGLNPGTTYTLGFYWICCEFLDPADFIIEVDGNVYDFPPSFEWTIVSVCVTAIGTSMDITVTAESQGNQSFVFVDDAFCTSLEPCCSLTLESEEELFICPNNDLILETLVENAQGDVSFEWTSDPPEGLDYLDDAFIEDPTFNFPTDLVPFDGLEFEFIVTAEDDECSVSNLIIVNVLPHIEITFDFPDNRYCQRDGIFEYPTVSNEGVSGNWLMPTIALEDYAGQDVENVFTPNEGDVDCVLMYPFEIEVEELLLPEFDLPTSFCDFEAPFFFPILSENDIEGSWQFEQIFPEILSEDTYINTFIPDDDFCIEHLEIEYDIIESTSAKFDLPDSLCTESEFFDLPTESLNNLDGFWTPSSIDPSSINNSLTAVFSSDEDECIENYVHTFFPLDEEVASFIIADTLCKNETPIFLTNLSLEGYVGQWNIVSFITDTLNADSINLVWVPEENSQCLDTFKKTVVLSDKLIPSFDFPLVLCASDGIFTFPILSQNNIEGTWSLTEFNPADNMDQSIENVFTPLSSDCTEALSIVISAVQEITPTFNFPDTICALDDVINFPMLSSENISGTWTTQQLNPLAFVGQNFINTFKSTDTSNSCITDSITLDIFVSPLITPLFNLPDLLCVDDDVIVLPTNSINGIGGFWNITEINPEENANSVLNLTFTSDNQNCHDKAEHSILVVGQFDGVLEPTAASNCDIADGSLLITGSQMNLEFSIDGGFTWQNESLYNNLAAGSYKLFIRFSDLDNCIEIFDFIIESPMLPQILQINATPLTSCVTDNGSIEILMQGTEFEYTIDQGSTWQLNNTFSDLPADTYEVSIRSSLFPECFVTITVDVNDVDEIIIIDLITQNPTGCQTNDGSIEIIASGLDLIFSIDTGSSWSNNTIFNNLSIGTYDVWVSSTTFTDCFDSQNIELLGNDSPVIDNIIVSNSNDCHPSSGVIEIISTNSDLEFSIDNGLSWHSQNTFINLYDGSYDVIIRSFNQPDCISQSMSVTIVQLPIEFVNLSDISLLQPSNCENTNGSIIINSINPTLEFSIDNGMNWQAQTFFDNLIPGEYTLQIRLNSDHDCIKNIETLLLEMLECPCEELETTAIVEDIFCSNLNNGSAEIVEILGFNSQIDEVLWDNGNTGLQVNNLDQGWHVYTILYDVDCSFSDSIYIEKYDPLQFFLEVFDTKCGEENNGQIDITEVSGGTGNYNYTLNGSTNQSESSFYNLSADEYEVMVLDSIGCFKSETIEVLLGPVIEVSLPSIVSISFGSSLYLNPMINESTIDSFIWSPQTGILNSDELIALVAPQESTDYELTIYYGDCVEVRSIRINVIANEDIYVGSIFSPNDDGNNDEFFIQTGGDNLLNVQFFKIFDRWGNLIFNKNQPLLNDPNDGWDGRLNDKKVIPGVYVYMISYLVESEEKFKVGTVTLIR